MGDMVKRLRIESSRGVFNDAALYDEGGNVVPGVLEVSWEIKAGHGARATVVLDLMPGDVCVEPEAVQFIVNGPSVGSEALPPGLSTAQALQVRDLLGSLMLRYERQIAALKEDASAAV